MRSNKRIKKKTALVLGYEIEYNRRIADRNSTTFTEAIRRSREALKSGEIELTRINVIFHSAAFDNPQTDLTPLSESLVAKVVDLYRWLDNAEHDKQVNNQILEDIHNLADTTTPQEGDAERMRLKAEGSIKMVEAYVESLSMVSKKASVILAELQKIEKIETGTIELPSQQVMTSDTIRLTLPSA